MIARGGRPGTGHSVSKPNSKKISFQDDEDMVAYPKRGGSKSNCCSSHAPIGISLYDSKINGVLGKARASGFLHL